LRQYLEGHKGAAVAWGKHLLLVEDLIQAIEKGELPIDLPTSGGSTTRAVAADLENEVVEVVQLHRARHEEHNEVAIKERLQMAVALADHGLDTMRQFIEK
jgi:hypothetical protein